MSYAKQFKKTLNGLFERRTGWLRREIHNFKPGPPLKWDKGRLYKTIEELQEIARNALAEKLAKKEFKQRPCYRKKISGWGDDEKKRNFEKWYDKKVADEKCVYVFVGKTGDCLWVGRTKDGKKRPASHLEKSWAKDTKQINIYPVKNKTDLHKLECLAWHRFRPKKNKNKPAREKNAKKCPMCGILRIINTEIKSIFRFKK